MTQPHDPYRSPGTRAGNDAIRRAKPTVDSPLAALIAGRIDQAEYRRRLAVKRLREEGILIQRLDPDPLVPDGWEQYSSPPETDDSGASLAYVVGAVAVVLAVVVAALVLGWRP